MPDEQQMSEIEEYIQGLEQQLKTSNSNTRELAHSQMSLMNSEENKNLIEWQVDSDKELEDIKHQLRGDVLIEDEKGNQYYQQQTDLDLIPFNEKGVMKLINLLKFYFSKQILLSNHSDEIINWKVLDFGIRLSDLLYNNYEEIMMTTSFDIEFKKLYPNSDLGRDINGQYLFIKDGKSIPLTKEIIKNVEYRIEEHMLNKIKMIDSICGAIVDCVHGAYLRSLNGEEKKSFREARTVNQNAGLYSQGQMNFQKTPQKSGGFFGLFK